MKFLFLIHHAGFVRHFTSSIGQLCQEGHAVHLAFHSQKVSPEEWTRDLRRDHPQVTYTAMSPRRADVWAGLALRLRAMRDYGMYFERRYAKAKRLRAFAARELSSGSDRALVDRIGAVPGLMGVFDWLLHQAELAIPPDPKLDSFIAEHAPDAVLVTPLVAFNSPQVDFIKSARNLGIPTGLCVASWDNLTNKGKMRVLPDQVMVWNDAQVEEAVRLHGMERRRVKVTGAQSFDHWFEMEPSRTREVFLRERGLDSSKAFFLYLCSSTSISPKEIEFIRQWHDAVRGAADPRIAGAALMVRPHPMNKQPWGELDALNLPNFTVWPRGSEGPFEPQERRDYLDSIHHADAVVGLNTSGQVEAGLMGRPVMTLLSKSLPHTLYGTTDTIHFQHLLRVNGGLLHVARSFEEHLRQLARALDGDPALIERSRRFTESFIRPHGLDVPAGPFLAAAMKGVADVKPRKTGLAAAVTGPLLRPRLQRIAERMQAARRKAKQLAASKA